MRLNAVMHKIAALYLFWFVIVFVLVTADVQFDFLTDGIREFLARYPYAFDYELMFTVFFVVWAYFLWNDKGLSLFSGVAFVAQGIAMVFLATIGIDSAHLFLDAIPWVLIGALLMYSSKNHALL